MRCSVWRLLLLLGPGLSAGQQDSGPLLLHSESPGAVPASNIRAMQTQYETMPYPPRQPDSPVHLTELSIPFINYLAWGGKRDIAAGLQALMVGDGTGDGTLELASLMRDLQCPPHLCHCTYVDLSRSSLKVAKSRIDHFQLSAWVTFVNGPILQVLPQLPVRHFDLVCASGVVHHQVRLGTDTWWGFGHSCIRWTLFLRCRLCLL